MSQNTIEKSWKHIYDSNSKSDKQLNEIALYDLNRKYTYSQMFECWEKYARVFTALNITAANSSRIAIFDANSVETIFAMYAANMTGASVSGFSPSCLFSDYPLDKTIIEEHITDILINDLVINKDMLTRLCESREELGIRNIIIVDVSIKHEEMDQELVELSETNNKELRENDEVLFMDDLIEKYDANPISYATEENDQYAFIMHTSGTTKGIMKPVPLSDSAMNAAAESIVDSGKFGVRGEHMTVMTIMVATSVYGLVDQVHAPLVNGYSLVVIPFSNANLLFSKAISMFKAEILFSTPFYFEMWNNAPAEFVPDFTSVKCVIVGGAYMSAEARARFYALIEKHGGKPLLVNGYGMSEVGGACIVQTNFVDDDSIGYPLPGVKIKTFDEVEEKFYSYEDKHTGVMYIHSDFITHGKIDGEEFLKVDYIDGIPYINTNDVVSIDENGQITCRGRANRFFVNNEGVKFNAGLIDNSITAEKGIEACALVPWFDKLVTGDTVPVLYVKPLKNDDSSVETVRNALINVFINNDVAEETNLPMQCVIVEQIPRNQNGKVDIYKITNGSITGDRYIIRPKYKKKKLADIELEFVSDSSNGIQNGAIPRELKKVQDSSNNVEQIDETTVLDVSIKKLTGNMLSGLKGSDYVLGLLSQMVAGMISKIDKDEEGFLISKLEDYCNLLYASKIINTRITNSFLEFIGMDAIPEPEEPDDEYTPEIERIMNMSGIENVPNIKEILAVVSKIQKLERESNRVSFDYLLSLCSNFIK